MKPGYLAAVALWYAGCSGHSEPPAAPTNVNPVQHEMRILTAALQNAVRGIGTGDVRGIAHELHGVHAAKQRTEAALTSGSHRLRKGHERLADFRALDEQFHRKLEGLVRASQDNDVSATADAFAGVMQGCTPCHAAFRP